MRFDTDFYDEFVKIKKKEKLKKRKFYLLLKIQKLQLSDECGGRI